MILLARGIIREIKSRRMEQARQVACTGVKRNVYRDLVSKPKRNPHLGDLDIEARILLNAS